MEKITNIKLVSFSSKNQFVLIFFKINKQCKAPLVGLVSCQVHQKMSTFVNRILFKNNADEV